MHFSMLTYPVTLRDIGKFERINDISVNVVLTKKNRRNILKKKELEEGEREKRKTSCRNCLSHKRKKLDFIDDEAVLSGDESQDEEESATMEDGIEDLIDESDDDVAMYRTLEQKEQAVEIEQLQQRFVDSVGSDDGGSEKQEDANENDSKRGMVYPVGITKAELARHINLLFTKKDSVCHYSIVKNISVFFYHLSTLNIGENTITTIHVFMGLKQKRMKRSCEVL